jgi:pyruvate formate lyase activating enzyme
MIFGGLQKNSFIDFPGKISAVFFVSGCNFCCPYCHNPELAEGKPVHPLDEQFALDFLDGRKGFLEGVVISGGEPTLQSGLAGFCRQVKQMGYPIKLDTNGSRPQVLKALLAEGLVDTIAMDLKTDPGGYQPLIRQEISPEVILASIEIIMAAAPDYEFRTTCLEPFVDKSTIERLSRLIQGAKRYALQTFRETKVLNPEFFKKNACGYRKAHLIEFKAIAEQWVQACILR